MSNFTNGKMTTSAIFFNTGVPKSDKNFGTFTTINYQMLRQISRHMRNKKGGRRQIYKLF